MNVARSPVRKKRRWIEEEEEEEEEETLSNCVFKKESDRVYDPVADVGTGSDENLRKIAKTNRTDIGMDGLIGDDAGQKRETDEWIEHGIKLWNVMNLKCEDGGGGGGRGGCGSGGSASVKNEEIYEEIIDLTTETEDESQIENNWYKIEKYEADNFVTEDQIVDLTGSESEMENEEDDDNEEEMKPETKIQRNSPVKKNVNVEMDTSRITRRINVDMNGISIEEMNPETEIHRNSLVKKNFNVEMDTSRITRRRNVNFNDISDDDDFSSMTRGILQIPNESEMRFIFCIISSIKQFSARTARILCNYEPHLEEIKYNGIRLPVDSLKKIERIEDMNGAFFSLYIYQCKKIDKKEYQLCPYYISKKNNTHEVFLWLVNEQKSQYKVIKCLSIFMRNFFIPKGRRKYYCPKCVSQFNKSVLKDSHQRECRKEFKSIKFFLKPKKKHHIREIHKNIIMGRSSGNSPNDGEIQIDDKMNNKTNDDDKMEDQANKKFDIDIESDENETIESEEQIQDNKKLDNKGEKEETNRNKNIYTDLNNEVMIKAKDRQRRAKHTDESIENSKQCVDVDNRMVENVEGENQMNSNEKHFSNQVEKNLKKENEMENGNNLNELDEEFNSSHDQGNVINQDEESKKENDEIPLKQENEAKSSIGLQPDGDHVFGNSADDFSDIKSTEIKLSNNDQKSSSKDDNSGHLYFNKVIVKEKPDFVLHHYEAALGQICQSYYFIPQQELSDYVELLKKARPLFCDIVSANLKRHKSLKLVIQVKMTFFAEDNKNKNNKTDENYLFNYEPTLAPLTIAYSSNVSKSVNYLFDQIFVKIEEILTLKSDLVYFFTNFLKLNVIQFMSISAGSQAKLPTIIAMKRATINVPDERNMCLVYCIIASIFNISGSSSIRFKSYTPYLSKINFNGIKFPITSIASIKNIEKINDKLFSIYIYAYRLTKKGCEFYPYYVSDINEARHEVYLLLVGEENSHFVVIKSLQRLMKGIASKSTTSKFFCPKCLHHFGKRVLRDSHKATCNKALKNQLTLPPRSTSITFNNHKHLSRNSFFICSQGEASYRITRTGVQCSKPESQTKKYSWVKYRYEEIHCRKCERCTDDLPCGDLMKKSNLFCSLDLSAFAYNIIATHDENISIPLRSYRAQSEHEVNDQVVKQKFLDFLCDDAIFLKDLMKKTPGESMTKEMAEATQCSLCKVKFPLNKSDPLFHKHRKCIYQINSQTESSDIANDKVPSRYTSVCFSCSSSLKERRKTPVYFNQDSVNLCHLVISCAGSFPEYIKRLYIFGEHDEKSKSVSLLLNCVDCRRLKKENMEKDKAVIVSSTKDSTEDQNKSPRLDENEPSLSQETDKVDLDSMTNASDNDDDDYDDNDDEVDASEDDIDGNESDSNKGGKREKCYINNERQKSCASCKKMIGFKFINSRSFLNLSLEKMAESLGSNFSPVTCKECGENMEKQKHCGRCLQKCKATFNQTFQYLSECKEATLFPKNIKKSQLIHDYASQLRHWNERQFPSYKQLYSATDQKSAIEYNEAISLYNRLNCQNIGEFVLHRLRLDATLLTDVMINFRNILFDNFGLDIMGYGNIKDFVYDAAKKVCNLQMDFSPSVEMHEEFLDGIKGRFSNISHKFFASNDEAIPPIPREYAALTDSLISIGERTYKYKHQVPSQQTPGLRSCEKDNTETWSGFFDSCFNRCNLLSLSINDFYSFIMKNYPLPYKDFRYLEGDELKKLSEEFFTQQGKNIQNFGEDGFLLTVDLEYPPEIQEELEAFPLLLEKRKVKREELSLFTKSQLQETDAEPGDAERLIADFKPKTKYQIHFVYLKFVLSKGVRLLKIHSAIAFKQKVLFRDFFKLTFELREKSRTDLFSYSIYETLLDSLLAKLLESEHDKFQYTYVSQRRKAFKFISDYSFLDCAVLSPKSLIVKSFAGKVPMKKPVYLANVIMDLAKCFLVHKVHDSILSAFKIDGTKNCFVFSAESDSVGVACFYDSRIQGNDYFYKKMATLASDLDVSSYDLHHPYFALNPDNKSDLISLQRKNAGRPGKFKDSLDSDEILAQFVGLRPKVFSYLIYNTRTGVFRERETPKFKRNDLHFNYAISTKNQFVKTPDLVSNQHATYLGELANHCARHSDTKLYWLNSLKSLPFHHRDVGEIEKLMETQIPRRIKEKIILASIERDDDDDEDDDNDVVTSNQPPPSQTPNAAPCQDNQSGNESPIGETV